MSSYSKTELQNGLPKITKVKFIWYFLHQNIDQKS